jgi:hypothetical protein
VRFGARTATAPVLIGLVFVLLGIGFGESGYALLKPKRGSSSAGAGRDSQCQIFERLP